MMRVPKLQPCPKCSIELEAGGNPDGLAWHGCEPGRPAVEDVSRTPTEIVEALLRRDDLTMQQAGLCYTRLFLARMVRDPEASTGDPGGMLEGMAKFITSKDSGKGGGLEELLAELRKEES